MSDQELLDIYKTKRDLKALGVLYKRYMLLVYGVCMKYLKHREDSQDAVMQIFEVLVADIPRFEIRHFKSWLYGVSRNHCLMKIRKDHSEKNRFEKNRTEIFMESADEMHLFDENNDEEMQLKLKACMDKLKEDQRSCVELFYYQNFCYREIAEKLSFDENQVKSFIQNGKRNLKICIETKSTIKNVENRTNI